MSPLQYVCVIGVLNLCFVYTAGEESVEPVEMVTVDAAYSYPLSGNRQFLILFVGNKVQVLVNHEPTVIYDRESFHLPSSMKVQAAYTRPNEPFYRRYFGDKYGYNVYPNTDNKKTKYGKQKKFLKNGGPDAAGKRSGVVYFFKGCDMIIRKTLHKWGKIRDMRSVGLPCDIDAAWAEGDKMVALKGDEYWNWEADNSVNGPHAFHDNYTLAEWRLTPVSDRSDSSSSRRG